MYLVQRYDMRALFLRRLLETGQPFYVVIRGTRKSSLCGANTVPSFVSYFRTLRAGPAPAGIEPTTLRSRFLYSQTLFYGHPLNTDTSLLWTVCFVPGEKTPYIFSKFNPLNTDTSLIRTISTDPLMSVLTGFDCSLYE